jgi:uncharacterized repeat protein (TIGR03803 family)
MILVTRALAALCATLTCFAGAANAVAAETNLYGFQCAPDGSEPLAGLVQTKSGNLLGTTFAGGGNEAGTVFNLAPPGSGGTNWTESVLYSFDSNTEQPPVTDAVHPMASLVLGHLGAFYGTGYYSADSGCGGSGCGAVFAMTHRPTLAVTPHPASVWHENVIYDFLGTPDGQNPIGKLVADFSGTLYGVTTNGGAAGAGAVFKLTAPGNEGQAWTETILYSFQNQADGGFPAAGLLTDKTGALYGTTPYSGDFGEGTVFKLTPPTRQGNPWTESVLYTFGLSGAPDDGNQPMAGLIADSNGALYGTTIFGGTQGDGAVFMLTPPSGGQTTWTETTLYSFMNNGDGALPGAALLLQKRNLYGTTEGTGGTGSYGSVFQLAPPAAGMTAWTETTMYKFAGTSDGKYPVSALVADSAGNLYGTAETGGPHNCGVAFEVAP